MADYLRRQHFLGTSEIRVICSESRIYAAPDLIFHYMRDHHYQPPDEFLDALETGYPPESREYQEILRKLALYRYATMLFWTLGEPLPYDPKQTTLDDALDLIRLFEDLTGRPYLLLGLIDRHKLR